LSWVNRFDGLKDLDEALLEPLVGCSKVVTIEKGSVIFGPAKAPEHLVMLLDGIIQVQQISDSGKEIVLYRVHAGSSCVLTSACVLAYEDYSARGIAETEIEAALIPRNTFDDLMGESRDFRHFVMSAFTTRLTDMFHMIEEVAFKRIDHRLAHALIELSEQSSVVKATHQNLAAELGSAREVVSRQMAEFQAKGWVLQHRGMIEIINRAELQKLSES